MRVWVKKQAFTVNQLDSWARLIPNGRMQFDDMKRREFLAGTVAAAGSVLTGCLTGPSGANSPLRLGIDNFAVRAMGWNANQLIDYAKELRCDSLFITDLGPFESFQDKYLKNVKAYADDQGIKLYIGSWSICPTSPSFKDTWGTAEEHLALGIRDLLL